MPDLPLTYTVAIKSPLANKTIWQTKPSGEQNHLATKIELLSHGQLPVPYAGRLMLTPM